MYCSRVDHNMGTKQTSVLLTGSKPIKGVGQIGLPLSRHSFVVKIKKKNVFVNCKYLPLKSLEAHTLGFVSLLALCTSVILTLLVTDIKI